LKKIYKKIIEKWLFFLQEEIKFRKIIIVIVEFIFYNSQEKF